MSSKLSKISKTIKCLYDPNTRLTLFPLAYSPDYTDHDIFLFSVSSDNFPQIPKSGVKIIGGRRASGNIVPGACLFDYISPDDRELPLFFSSFFDPDKSITVFPMNNKILVVYNKLFRYNGLGIVFVYNYSPSAAAAILNSECADTFSNIRFSDSFYSIPANDRKAMDFIGSLSYFTSRLSERGLGNKASVYTAAQIIGAAADVMGCPIIIEYDTSHISDRRIDETSLFALCLCLISQAKRTSNGGEITVTITGESALNILFDYELSPLTEVKRDLTESFFCDKIANDSGIPYITSAESGAFRARFLPLKEDPSRMGFKSGVIYDGKRVINLSL